MNSNKKYFAIRLLVVVLVVLSFILLGFVMEFNVAPEIVNGDYRSRRSCLGNPLVLYYVFIGFPILLFLGLVDIVYLIIIIIKVTLLKVLSILFLMLCSFLFLFILPY